MNAIGCSQNFHNSETKHKQTWDTIRPYSRQETISSGIAGWLRNGFYGNPLVKRLLAVPLIQKLAGDVFFRMEASVCQGLFINLLYAGIKLFSGIYYRSVWFFTLAVYYIFLAAMRAVLLHFARTHGNI